MEKMSSSDKIDLNPFSQKLKNTKQRSTTRFCYIEEDHEKDLLFKKSLVMEYTGGDQILRKFL